MPNIKGVITKINPFTYTFNIDKITFLFVLNDDMKEDIKGNWISFNDITPYEVISKSKPEYKYLVSSMLHISVGYQTFTV